MIKSESRVRSTDGYASLTSASIDLSGRTTERRSLEAHGGGLSCEEVLVVDDRSALSPAQAVENRLSRLLKEASMPISHLQMRGMLRAR